MIFPTLHGQPVAANVNLDEVAKRWRLEHPGKFDNERNPLFTDPEECQRMIQDFHDRLRVAWSYGGWMENRSTIWKGGYMEEEGRFIHLGVDLNVPAGTEIAVDAPSRVVRFDIDKDMNGGWGPRLILDRGEQDPHLFVYAHLATDIRCKVGDVLTEGQVFANVGTPQENGHWYPHLHIQVLCKKLYEQILLMNEADRAQGLRRESEYDLASMDGYGIPLANEKERLQLEAEFPDPTRLLKIL